MSKTKIKYVLTLGVDCDLLDINASLCRNVYKRVYAGDQFNVIDMGTQDHDGQRYAIVISKWSPGVRALSGKIMYNEAHKMEKA